MACVLYFCIVMWAVLGCSLAEEVQADVNTLKNLLQNSTLQDPLVNAIKEKCESNAGAAWKTSYDTIIEARTKLEKCASDYVDIEKLKRDMEEKRKEGKLDEVFSEYCQKKQTVLDCVAAFADTLKPCLKDDEKNNLNSIQNVTSRLADFICYRDGDRIALFIAEKGLDCMQSQMGAIQECAKNHVDANTANGNLTINDVSKLSLSFDDEMCTKIDSMSNCIVEKMKLCSEPTPANIAEALFKFARKATPCNKSSGN